MGAKPTKMVPKSLRKRRSRRSKKAKSDSDYDIRPDTPTMLDLESMKVNSESDSEIRTDNPTMLDPPQTNVIPEPMRQKDFEETIITTHLEESSESVKWRKRGNDVLASVNEGLGPLQRHERYINCVKCYDKAFNLSTCDDERSSAAKNLGIVCRRMASLSEERNEQISLTVYHYKESLKYFSIADNLGKTQKSPAWVEGIYTSAVACYKEFRSCRVKQLDYLTRSRIYHDIVQHIDIRTVKAWCYYDLSTIHFRAGIAATQAKDFRTALYELNEASMPLKEAMSKGCDSQKIRSKCSILQEDMTMQLCLAESLQCLSTGDQLFEDVLKDQEYLNLDMVWEVVDWYKQVVLKTREVTEVELEAIALSRLGRLYDRILKLKNKAKECVKKSIELAASMHPRVFSQDDWYKESTEILERYQKEVVEQESEKWNKEREETLKELTDELKKLKENDQGKGNIEFIKYVYTTFPPKNPRHNLDSIVELKQESPNSKKALQTAIIHYHPDRNMDHGKQWKVMSEEVTKVLTRRYEVLKG